MLYIKFCIKYVLYYNISCLLFLLCFAIKCIIININFIPLFITYKKGIILHLGNKEFVL